MTLTNNSFEAIIKKWLGRFKLSQGQWQKYSSLLNVYLQYDQPYLNTDSSNFYSEIKLTNYDNSS